MKDNITIKTDGIIDIVYRRKNYENDFDIVLHQTEEVIGNIWFDKGKDKKFVDLYGNVGYQIKEEYQHNGFATRSLNLMKEILKDEQVKEMILSIEVDNEYSIKTAKKAGAVLSSTRIINTEKNNQYKYLIYKYKIGG